MKGLLPSSLKLNVILRTRELKFALRLAPFRLWFVAADSFDALVACLKILSRKELIAGVVLLFEVDDSGIVYEY